MSELVRVLSTEARAEANAWWTPHLRNWPHGRLPRKLKKRLGRLGWRYTWVGNLVWTGRLFRGFFRG